MKMRVEFYKEDEGRLCGWIATPPNHRAFEGTMMASGRDLPHDLAQFVVEQSLGLARSRALTLGDKLALEWTVSPLESAIRRPRNAARRGRPPARRR